MPFSRLPLRKTVGIVSDTAKSNRVRRLLFYTAFPNSDSGERSQRRAYLSVTRVTRRKLRGFRTETGRALIQKNRPRHECRGLTKSRNDFFYVAKSVSVSATTVNDFTSTRKRWFFRKLFSFSNSFFFVSKTPKFLHHLQLRLLLIVVLVFFAIRAFPVRNSGSEYTVLSHKAGNRVPFWMCARTWFRLIFTPCAFLRCWHYNLSGRGVTNSLYNYNPWTLHNFYS